ncbi:hypothetical protein KAJ38_02035 [Candidatus Pacearchaeota archaeon]|nr:hypothetical protein [Candidatus Pacearchaeota archaeon]
MLYLEEFYVGPFCDVVLEINGKFRKEYSNGRWNDVIEDITSTIYSVAVQLRDQNPNSKIKQLTPCGRSSFEWLVKNLITPIIASCPPEKVEYTTPKKLLDKMMQHHIDTVGLIERLRDYDVVQFWKVVIEIIKEFEGKYARRGKDVRMNTLTISLATFKLVDLNGELKIRQLTQKNFEELGRIVRLLVASITIHRPLETVRYTTPQGFWDKVKIL